MSTELVSISAPVEGARCVRLDRPDALSTLHRPLVDGLHRALDQVEADSDCRMSSSPVRDRPSVPDLT